MESSAIYSILIVGDSRLRNLGGSLETTSLNLRFTVRCIPGARIEELGLHIRACLSYQHDYDLVMLIGGINNITRIRFRPVRHATLRYLSEREICLSITSQLQEALEKIAEISVTPVVIATIPGMNLINYSPAYWYGLLHLQPTLDRAIVELNRRIRGINRLNGHPTPNLAYPVHRCSGRRGRYYAHYSFLLDGLHPGETLISRWSQRIINFCVALFPAIRHIQE